MNGQEKCPKCQSTEIISDIQVADRTLEEAWTPASDLKVEVATKPNAKIFKGIVGVPLKANVCGSCGYTELYVSDTATLLQAIEQRTRNSA